MSTYKKNRRGSALGEASKLKKKAKLNPVETYLIGYDLTRPRKDSDYPELIDAIKGLGTWWWHHLGSTWIVTTDKSAVQICETLRTHIDRGDKLFVAALSGESAWVGINEKGSAWLQNHL
jgi:hypothetical protein